MDIAQTLCTTRGAVAAVAKALGISQAAVSQWRGRSIPERRRGEVAAALAAHVEALGKGVAPAKQKARRRSAKKVGA